MVQIAGFAAVFALFLACGLAFYSLTASSQALQGFQAMYYISSFFAQFVNATTFLLVSCKKCRSFIVQSCESPALVMPIACISHSSLFMWGFQMICSPTSGVVHGLRPMRYILQQDAQGPNNL